MSPNIRDLRPTRRGIAVALIAVLAFALGTSAGARSLNAVVVPAVVALAAGAIQLARADDPTIDRSKPEPGFPGETRTLTVDIDSTVPCTATERLADGLSAVGEPPTEAVGHGGRFSYDVEFERRGGHDIEPTSCRLTDSLGLFRTELDAVEATTALVYPDIYEVDGAELSALIRRALGDDRSSFDRLREFAPGDTMRDIDWRASAKRPREEFVVAEYESYSESTHLDIVGESTLGSADAVAATVASIALHLHDVGASVTVHVPEGSCISRPGEVGSLLRLLALTGDGWVNDEERAGANVYVLGEGGTATVTFADHELEFENVAGAQRSHEVVS
ncbi:MAG: hypothetical protein ACI8UR_001973 [Natronomonas sp.]|jgi:uncharacterized protein (DUF58 family)|uniref:DUF58 domain-containing protein n=1 Tax=Natronomonas sp. TaxID=2184060 RepID=UPI003988DDDA